MDLHSAFSFFACEMRKNPALYVDATCNLVLFTALGEAYLDAHPEIKADSMEEDAVFEAVVDWFSQWSGRKNYNND